MVAGELACSSIAARDAIGVWSGRGRLMALVHGTGLYEADLTRVAIETQQRAAGAASEQPDQRALLAHLITGMRVTQLAQEEIVATPKVERELQLLQSQFQPNRWLEVLHLSAVSPGRFRGALLTNLQGEQWVERAIENEIQVTPQECLEQFQKSPAAYMQPARWRASHLFLAAPSETPEEVVAAKQAAIQAISDRIVHGEKFDDLVASTSEDEATKNCGGDLNFFSSERMPLDFLAAVQALQTGRVSGVVRTELGFHIVQLTAMLPARPLTFEQAQGEIALALGNGETGSRRGRNPSQARPGSGIRSARAVIQQISQSSGLHRHWFTLNLIAAASPQWPAHFHVPSKTKERWSHWSRDHRQPRPGGPPPEGFPRFCLEQNAAAHPELRGGSGGAGGDV